MVYVMCAHVHVPMVEAGISRLPLAFFTIFFSFLRQSFSLTQGPVASLTYGSTYVHPLQCWGYRCAPMLGAGVIGVPPCPVLKLQVRCTPVPGAGVTGVPLCVALGLQVCPFAHF